MSLIPKHPESRIPPSVTAVHSSAFLGIVMYSDLLPGKKTLVVVGVGAFYTLFVGAFAFLFRASVSRRTSSLASRRPEKACGWINFFIGWSRWAFSISRDPLAAVSLPVRVFEDVQNVAAFNVEDDVPTPRSAFSRSFFASSQAKYFI